jgi:hypothetical protein|tara:strand:- start:939 stop:1358 length:420 start_codon:yes stop_codon:yes gene_type:complete
MINTTLLKELEKLIEITLDPTMFPYQRGNSIRIGKMIVRNSKRGYLIFDSQDKKEIAITFSKTAAVALARSLSKGKDNTSKVIDLDKTIQKHYNDAMFYSYTLRTSTDTIRRDVSKTRLEIAKTHTENARLALDYIIFS